MASALKNALGNGVKMMDKYFDKVSFDLSDSEDDDEDVMKRFVIAANKLERMKEVL